MVRVEMVNNMKKNRGIYQLYIPKFDKYMDKLSKDGTWYVLYLYNNILFVHHINIILHIY